MNYTTKKHLNKKKTFSLHTIVQTYKKKFYERKFLTNQILGAKMWLQPLLLFQLNVKSVNYFRFFTKDSNEPMMDTLNVMNTFLKRQELFYTVFTSLQKHPKQGTSKISGVLDAEIYTRYCPLQSSLQGIPYYFPR